MVPQQEDEAEAAEPRSGPGLLLLSPRVQHPFLSGQLPGSSPASPRSSGRSTVRLCRLWGTSITAPTIRESELHTSTEKNPSRI